MDNRLLLELKRFCRRRRHRTEVSMFRRPAWYNPARITLLLAAAMSVIFISLLELRLRPIAEELAARQVNNRVTAQLNRALNSMETDYDGIVSIQRTPDGSITAVTSDMKKINEIRARAVQESLNAIAAIDVHTLGVPLGSLFDFDLLWAKGPVIEVHSLVAGTVTTYVRSDFQSAGINQTLHRVLLDVTVPLTVLLPGIRGETEVAVTVCVAETVIVGQVPQTYLNLAGGEENGRQTGGSPAAAGAGTGGV